MKNIPLADLLTIFRLELFECVDMKLSGPCGIKFGCMELSWPSDACFVSIRLAVCAYKSALHALSSGIWTGQLNSKIPNHCRV